MEVRASWRPALSDHACLTTCPAAAARRAQDCPPHRLRGLPQAAWTDLRSRYTVLAARVGVAAADEALRQPCWRQKSERG
eukprot:2383473-Alexandrium_andersonii.AAC.1